MLFWKLWIRSVVSFWFAVVSGLLFFFLTVGVVVDGGGTVVAGETVAAPAGELGTKLIKWSRCLWGRKKRKIITVGT